MTNWTPEQYRTHMENKSAKPSKYKNEKVEVDGEKFDSKKELARYNDLVLMEKAGKISKLQRQVKYHLRVNGILICTYIADHTYYKNGVLIVEDVKSKHTRTLPVYRIKRKLMAAIHRIDIFEH